MTVYNTNNKSFYVPGNNDNINTWDQPVNANWTGLDYSLGGVTYISVTGQSGTKTMIGTYSASATNNQYPPNGIGSSGSPVTTDPSYIPSDIIITGVLTSNIVYRIPSGVGGQWTVYNNTSGSYTVSFQCGTSTALVIEQGKRRFIVSDGSTIMRSDSPSDAQGETGTLQFNNGGSFSGSGIRYTPSTGNYVVGPLEFIGAVDVSGNLTTANNPPLSVGMIIKKVSDGSTIGTVTSGSGGNWVLAAGFTATLSTYLYAYPATAAGSGEAFVINGYDNHHALRVIGGKASGNSWGAVIVAGSSSSDYPLVIQDKDANGVFSVNGLGSVNITSRPSSTAWALNVTKPADTSGGGIYCNGGAFTSTVALTYGAPIQCDASKSNVFSITLTGSGGGLNITNAQNGQTINIVIKQDGTGNRTIAWSGIAWPYGVAGTLSTAANATDLLILTYINSQWYGTLINSLS